MHTLCLHNVCMSNNLNVEGFCEEAVVCIGLSLELLPQFTLILSVNLVSLNSGP